MPRFQRPTGTLDTLPEDQHYWDHVRRRARHLAELAGFERIDVPVFEATQLFARGIGAGTDVVDKEMYAFTDKGGHQLTLRPEFTAGVVRAYIENGLQVRPQPQKLYSFGPTFRYDRPQAGRYRQFTQFNVEILGEQDPVADVEVMALVWDLYAGLGFQDLEFQLNSTGCPRCRPGYVQVLKEHYARHLDVICEDCQRRLERSPLLLTTSIICVTSAPHISARCATIWICWIESTQSTTGWCAVSTITPRRCSRFGRPGSAHRRPSAGEGGTMAWPSAWVARRPLV